MSRSLALLARASARHPWRTILVWVVVLLSISAQAGTLDGEFVDDFRLPNSEAQQAADRLEESFPAVSGQGVTAGIDMALWLIGRLHGRPHSRWVRRKIQYEPAPPYMADEPLVS